eukprot:977472-Pelagomonas_calceolata.AAC.5
MQCVLAFIGHAIRQLHQNTQQVMPFHVKLDAFEAKQTCITDSATALQHLGVPSKCWQGLYTGFG